ncbi:acetyltransferase [Clostridium sp. AM58-1XD]|uniref:acetyltransferase n=1 Tax=Clostridium sp. AM58-1XD TaxID=2292307 RepID=UPI000E4E3CFE|nr:acetyltransferase [Clostridium sp. AM58-1XD]RGY97689.1 sialic acid O-acetyltransferase [Clostridium sp. AM58-1XD]
MKKLLIWGAGDQGTVTLECALAMNQYAAIDFLEIKEKGHRRIPGRVIYREDDDDIGRIIRSYDEIIVATGSNDLRDKKISRLISMERPLATVIHPTAVISPSAKIAGGCTILANAVVHTNAVVGTGCIINTAAVIEHDCIIEDFVNICPNASMAGHTQIGRKSFLGIGSTIIDGIRIGKEAVVGAGAVVIRNVPDFTTVVGVPAKPKSARQI